MTGTDENGKRIFVYTGPGASNSWVWLADFLEEYDFPNTRFCHDPKDLSGLSEFDLFVVPGGDTFRIANALGYDHLDILAKCIFAGTGYIGICAGAYLPLRSSLPLLNKFNLTDAIISNIAGEIPSGISDAERYSVPYGCSIVFHPMRGPVNMTGDRELKAPLYGGPIIVPSAEDRVRLVFSSLEENSETLIAREVCESVIGGNAACIETKYGKGRVLLISPHLEHPDYPIANEYLANLLDEFRSNGCRDSESGTDMANLTDLRRVIADLRLRANALGTQSWKIGVKYWEGEKLLFFIDAVRRRIEHIRKGRKEHELSIPIEALHAFEEARSALREGEGNASSGAHEDLVEELSKGASIFLNGYFAMLSGRRQARANR